MKNKAVYPGSFDPVTLGHQEIIRRVASIFDEVVVLVADSLKKSYFFSREEREALLKQTCRDLKNVKVTSFAGLTTQFATDNDIGVIIRSLRGSNDWDLESTMAQANKKLAPDIETLFIMTQPELAHISSSFVKEIAVNRGSLSHFVSAEVEKAITDRLKRGTP